MLGSAGRLFFPESRHRSVSSLSLDLRLVSAPWFFVVLVLLSRLKILFMAFGSAAELL
jgi:hypothetical protein